MAILHRSTESSIAVTTCLSGPRLAEIAEFVAETTEFEATVVCVEGYDARQPRFSMRSGCGAVEDLAFHLAITSTGAMCTAQFAVDRALGRVDGPTKCRPAYLQFMQRFGDIVRIEDPAALILVI